MRISWQYPPRAVVQDATKQVGRLSSAGLVSGLGFGDGGKRVGETRRSGHVAHRHDTVPSTPLDSGDTARELRQIAAQKTVTTRRPTDMVQWQAEHAGAR